MFSRYGELVTDVEVDSNSAVSQSVELRTSRSNHHGWGATNTALNGMASRLFADGCASRKSA
ncbi:MAG TPA: hypothetical protein VKB88_01765 [Bryobacteraceae bacterium]|nr:hypothetical protein [Bryobacteraceae bacterium]